MKSNALRGEVDGASVLSRVGTGGVGGSSRRGGRQLAIGAVVLLAVHSGLLAWQAHRDSATWDEVGHFAAGLSHWYDGDFTLYRVNPPLVRLVAAAPVVLLEPKLDVGPYLPDLPGANPFVRDDFACGERVAKALGERYFRLLAFSRWAVIPFSILGGWVCYLWAAELFGGAAGLLATALWAFCPNVLAYGHLIVPDTAAAALGVSAAYLFWRWLEQPVWRRAAAAGVVMGLAQLTKTTWIVLFALWPVTWLAYRLLRAGGANVWRSRREGLQLGAMLVLAVWVINLGYGYEGSFRPLRSFAFASRALSGAPAADESHGEPGNRFAGTWLGRVPVPLPSNYLRGIDFIKMEYERKYWSYLRGELRFGGWWYYYLYALLVKVPAGTWCLLGLAVFSSLFRRGYAAPLRDELVLLVPPAVVLTLVSSQTGFSHHLRYVLPIFPFAFIWISKLGRSARLGHARTAAAAALALAASVASSLWVYPHSMSYFNEFVGGPANGHYHLGNSNTDWGQDLLNLKRWLDRHPQAKPLYVGYDLPLIDPRVLGIEYASPPIGVTSKRAGEFNAEDLGPKPGWHVISVNWIQNGDGFYDYFLWFTPVDRIGYSMHVYHLTPDDVSRFHASHIPRGAPGHATEHRIAPPGPPPH